MLSPENMCPKRFDLGTREHVPTDAGISEESQKPQVSADVRVAATRTRNKDFLISPDGRVWPASGADARAKVQAFEENVEDLPWKF